MSLGSLLFDIIEIDYCKIDIQKNISKIKY